MSLFHLYISFDNLGELHAFRKPFSIQYVFIQIANHILIKFFFFKDHVIFKRRKKVVKLEATLSYTQIKYIQNKILGYSFVNI